MTTGQQIYLFGELQTKPTLKFFGRNAQRLLVFLLLGPDQAHPRDRLASELWPADPPAHGRRLLSDALYRLRQTIPAHWLNVQTEALTLHTPPDLWVDLWAFQKLARSENEAQLAEAAALYRGDLLPEFEDAWLHPLRERVRDGMTAVLQKLAERAENKHQFAQAQQYYNRKNRGTGNGRHLPMKCSPGCGRNRPQAARRRA